MEVCKTCCWSHEYVGGLQCRRHAPVLIQKSYDTVPRESFPTVNENDWCGDWYV